MALPRFPPAPAATPPSLAAAISRWNELVGYLDAHPQAAAPAAGSGPELPGSAIDAIVLLALAQVSTLLVLADSVPGTAIKAGEMATLLVRKLGRSDPRVADVGPIVLGASPPPCDPSGASPLRALQQPALRRLQGAAGGARG